MNRISKVKELMARQIFMTGESISTVIENVGISKETARTLRIRLLNEVGIIYCACGKNAGHKGWCGPRIAKSPSRIAWMMGALNNINTVTFNIYVPSRPRYERPDIPNEHETEIPLLVNRRHIRSLDAPVFDGDDCGHTIIKSGAMTPLDILIMKEEANSIESKLARVAMDDWERFQNCKRMGLEKEIGVHRVLTMQCT